MDFDNQPNGHLWTGSLPRCHSAFLLSLTHQLSSAATPALHVSQAAPWPCCQRLLILHPSLAPSPARYLGGKSQRGPLGRASFLQPCNDLPSTRKKPNLTRVSYLGQRNAELRARKNVRRGISVPLPGFCSLSEIQALIYSNRRVLIIDLQPPHPTHGH